MSTNKNESGKIRGQTTDQATKKSGKGNSHGFISEVSTYFTVKPGHEEDARAACRRFGEMLRNSDPKDDNTVLRLNIVCLNRRRQVLSPRVLSTLEV